MKNTIRLIAGIALAGFLSLSAHADFIDGSITFSGDFVPTGGAGVNLSDAIGIDFIGDDFDIDGTAGDFALAGIVAGDAGVINDFIFNPLTPNSLNLWSIAGFNFVLDSITIDFQNANFIALSGSGAVMGIGFDPTPGVWSLSANTSGQGGTLFNFSSGANALKVSEPTTMLLFGLGLIALIGGARRRARS